MKKYSPFLLALVLLTATVAAWAQPDRMGQAGNMNLLLNPWSRSAGLNNIDIASSQGAEAIGINPAGVGKAAGTELVLSRTQLYLGADITMSAGAFTQKLGTNGGAFGLAVTSMGFGDMVRTTNENPDGELGTFNLSQVQIGVAYARQFTEHIYVGANMNISNTSTSQISSSAVSFDAGLQYRTGERERVKFGIALRNVGPQAQFRGQGTDNRAYVRTTNAYTSALTIPTATYEVPTCLMLGGSYDFFMGDESALTLMGTFVSNSFYYNQFGVGTVLNYKNMFMARAGYLYEQGLLSDLGVERWSVTSGPAAGVTFQLPFDTGRQNDNGDAVMSSLGVDLGYKVTNPFGGVFNFGLRLDI
jgi:hypothetical protein